MTQKLDQMTATTLSSTPTNTTTAKINSLPSAFEQTDIQTTLKKTALSPEQLTHILNLAEIPSSTKRIKPLNNFLGQDRARASVEAGISLPYSGYNIFAVGTAGLGKRTMIKRLLQQHAKTMPTPNDWVYVNNFKNPRQPIALRFPAGQGTKFQNALQQTWQIILKQLERRFSAESYHNRIERIRQDTGDVQQQALVEAATSNLHLAELNMHRAAVVAPADGTLSNFDLRPGNYVQVGQAVAALLDRKQLYVVGYFEETKLDRIHIGDEATVQLMGDRQKIKGHVQGIASGIEDRERSSSSKLLANVNPTFSWVRLAQRVPVKIVLDEAPKNELAFVSGRTATVHIIEK